MCHALRPLKSALSILKSSLPSAFTIPHSAIAISRDRPITRCPPITPDVLMWGGLRSGAYAGVVDAQSPTEEKRLWKVSHPRYSCSPVILCPAPSNTFVRKRISPKRTHFPRFRRQERGFRFQKMASFWLCAEKHGQAQLGGGSELVGRTSTVCGGMRSVHGKFNRSTMGLTVSLPSTTKNDVCSTP